MNANIKKGFTLIELLIVMAILGVLAVIVLVAINPVEQLARARDTGRISAVQQIGRAAVAYYTANTQYPAANTNWWVALTQSGDLQVFPTAVSTTDPTCSALVHNGYCYDFNGSTTDPQALVYSQLISQQQKNKCNGSANVFSVFNTFDSKGGVICGNGTSGNTSGTPSAGQTFVYQ